MNRIGHSLIVSGGDCSPSQLWVMVSFLLLQIIFYYTIVKITVKYFFFLCHDNNVIKFDPKKTQSFIGLGWIFGKPVKIVKRLLYYLVLGMFMDKVKKFCDHSMILWEMAGDLLTDGLNQPPPAVFRVKLLLNFKAKGDLDLDFQCLLLLDMKYHFLIKTLVGITNQIIS